MTKSHIIHISNIVAMQTVLDVMSPYRIGMGGCLTLPLFCPMKTEQSIHHTQSTSNLTFDCSFSKDVRKKTHLLLFINYLV